MHLNGPLYYSELCATGNALSQHLDICKGKIQTVFEIGNRFRVLENRRPTSDRSTNDIRLRLFNSHQTDLSYETQIQYTCLLHELSIAN